MEKKTTSSYRIGTIKITAHTNGLEYGSIEPEAIAAQYLIIPIPETQTHYI